MSFHATVTIAEVDRRLRWTGTIATPRLFRGDHIFTLTPLPGGRTRVTNEEPFTGFLTTLLKPFMSQASTGGYAAFNAGLKRYVESRVHA